MKPAPYFLMDERWYTTVEVVQEDGWVSVEYELTNEAPLEAIKAYNEYYAPYMICEDEDGGVSVYKRLKDGSYETTIDGKKTILYI